MENLILIVVLTLLAGLAMPLGALLASVEHIKSDWLETEFRHAVIAFGGGALLAAVALVLVPQGIVGMPPLLAALYFCAGGMAFMLIDILLYRLNTPAAQFVAMLADFIPEALALGAAFVLGGVNLWLLAALMALQNLPEGFNAYREFVDTGRYSKRFVLRMFVVLAWLGPVAGLSGALWLADYPNAVSAMMLFASGGILYSIFQDIAPQAKLERHWGPSFGAVLGFMLGLFGHVLSHG